MTFGDGTILIPAAWSHAKPNTRPTPTPRRADDQHTLNAARAARTTLNSINQHGYVTTTALRELRHAVARLPQEEPTP